MIEYIVRIDGDNVFINGEQHYFGSDIDEGNKEDDLNEKALIALAEAMGYETTVLFDEMADRLWDIINEEDGF